MKAAESFNASSIRKEFRKFGEIESVEILNNGKFETYVTFVDDKSAALGFAFTTCENEQLNKSPQHKKWFVEPANTWHQPPQISVKEYVDAMDVDHLDQSILSPIFNLTEYCFDYLFKFCDLESLINLSQVCIAFKTLLDENGSANKYFRQFSTLSIYVNDLSEDKYTTLSIARKKLRRVGKHVKKLEFEFDDSGYNWNLHRYLEKINQYVGENVRELVITDACLSENHLNLLKPILQHVHVLKIINLWVPYFYAIDLKKLCPNLTKLKLIMTEIKIANILSSWPKLEYLSLQRGKDDYNLMLLENNHHLKGLKIEIRTDQEIRWIANLLNMQKLAICNREKQISTTQLINLSRLPLTELTLSLINHTSLEGTVVHLIGFKMLRVLKLHVNMSRIDNDIAFNQQAMIDLAQNLLHLEKLFLFEFPLTASTVISIIRFATNLKIFHFHDCKVELSTSIISQIVDVRKSQQHQEQHKKLLKLFVDKKGENWDKEIQRYVRVDFGCDHNSFNW